MMRPVSTPRQSQAGPFWAADTRDARRDELYCRNNTKTASSQCIQTIVKPWLERVRLRHILVWLQSGGTPKEWGRAKSGNVEAEPEREMRSSKFTAPACGSARSVAGLVHGTKNLTFRGEELYLR